MQVLEFHRRYSFFAPTFTYAVHDRTPREGGTWIGEVARNEGDPHTWWASTKTWTSGGDLVQTFRTRRDAAIALQHLADGTATPETYGGYATTKEDA